jgi:Domain of unknown function (DUF4136)
MSRTHTAIRRVLLGTFLGLFLLLGGCASVYLVDNQVQSFASWGTAATAPAAPQSYRFERLPSQREGDAAVSQNALEDLTRAALARVGWNLAEATGAAPWTVQVSGGALKLPRAPWEEPWDGFGAGWGLYGGGGAWGSTLFMRMDIPYYERQVSLVVRQAATGQVVYETSARHDGRWNSSPELWSAMLDAALRDFPNPPTGARQVNIEVPR